MNSQSHDNRHCLVAQIAVMPEALSRVCVANVQLDEGDIDAQQRVADGDARVCVGGRVDDDDVDVASRRVYALNDGALGVGLEGLQVCAEGLGVFF